MPHFVPISGDSVLLSTEDSELEAKSEGDMLVVIMKDDPNPTLQHVKDWE